MRPALSILVSSILAAACSQLLGIDGRYSRADEEAPGAGGRPEHHDAGSIGEGVPEGNGGQAEPPPDVSSAGGAPGGSTGELGPPPFEMGGEGSMPPSTRDAGSQPCALGSKVCGDTCTPMSPDNGCGGPTCDRCKAHANAHTSCAADGACESVCNPGFDAVNAECVAHQSGTGGTPGTGGAGTGGTNGSGGRGSGGSNGTCDPLQCPACNSGFEGCCIPGVPNGPPSRCGCFYLPLFCTARVG